MTVKVGNSVTTMPSGLALAAGRINDIELKGTSGLNATVGTSLETVCNQGGIRNILSSAEDLKVSSSSSDDTNTGSAHARWVRIRGLDTNGEYKQQDVYLNGTNVVTTDKNGDAINFKHVNDFRVQKVGSGSGFNAGTISLYANDGTTVLSQIGVGENQQQGANWAIGSNELGYLTSFVASATGNAQVSIWLSPNYPNTPFFQKLTVLVGSGGPTPYQLPNPFQIPSNGIIEFRAKSLTGSDVAVGSDFQVLIESNV